MATNEWARLGREVVAARSARWHTRKEFAAVCGLSIRVVSDIERGRRDNYDPATLGTIQNCLGWEPGSVERVLNGGKPKVAVDPLLKRLHDAWPHLSTDAQRMLVRQAEDAIRQR